MTLKRKLTLGLGFLFLIIFVLVIISSFNVGKLSHEAENILKDNYQSLVLSKNMLSSLEDMRTAVSSLVFNPSGEQEPSGYYLKLYEAGRTEFEKNLKAENNNITEIHEAEYVTTVNADYASYTNVCQRVIKAEGGRALYFGEYQPAFDKLRHAINNINDVNMQAVERKSQSTQRDAAKIISLMAIIGVFSLILAFGYFWYFPFYVSNSIAFLAERMKGLLKKADLTLDIRTNDESFILLQGINLLENKLGAKDEIQP